MQHTWPFLLVSCDNINLSTSVMLQIASLLFHFACWHWFCNRTSLVFIVCIVGWKIVAQMENPQHGMASLLHHELTQAIQISPCFYYFFEYKNINEMNMLQPLEIINTDNGGCSIFTFAIWGDHFVLKCMIDRYVQNWKTNWWTVLLFCDYIFCRMFVIFMNWHPTYPGSSPCGSYSKISLCVFQCWKSNDYLGGVVMKQFSLVFEQDNNYCLGQYWLN